MELLVPAGWEDEIEWAEWVWWRFLIATCFFCGCCSGGLFLCESFSFVLLSRSLSSNLWFYD